jgi:hypothetical protein
MTTTTTSHFAMLRGSKSNDWRAANQPLSGRDSRIPVAIAFGVALGAVVALLASQDAPGSRVRALPAAQRAAVLERTVGNLRDVCKANDRPREFCRGQAELALSLPECTEACQSLAREELRADSAVK